MLCVWAGRWRHFFLALNFSSWTMAQPTRPGVSRAVRRARPSRPMARPRQSIISNAQASDWIFCLDPSESITERLQATLFEWNSLASRQHSQLTRLLLLRARTGGPWLARPCRAPKPGWYPAAGVFGTDSCPLMIARRSPLEGSLVADRLSAEVFRRLNMVPSDSDFSTLVLPASSPYNPLKIRHCPRSQEDVRLQFSLHFSQNATN